MQLVTHKADPSHLSTLAPAPTQIPSRPLWLSQEQKNLVRRGIPVPSLKPAQSTGDLSKKGPGHAVCRVAWKQHCHFQSPGVAWVVLDPLPSTERRLQLIWGQHRG